jgi:hypothetical protein
MTIGVGKEEGGLYHLLQDRVSVLPFNYVLNNSTLLNSAVLHFNNHNGNPDQSVTSSLWHYRLGHLSNKPLQLLSHVIPQLVHDSNKSCSVCPLAKQHRLSFPHSESISHNPFDLIHCDI